MSTSRENFKQNLKQLLFDKGMTCTALSKILKVAPTTVREWRRGIIFPRSDMLDKIAAFFNLTTNELLSASIKSKQENINMENIDIENELIEYKKLNINNRRKVIEFIHTLRTNEIFQTNEIAHN